jgi:pimeloyl-ACP methyl ester carboxylesterase
MKKKSTLQLAIVSKGAGKPTATTSETEFAEVGGRTIAYRSIGRGFPIIMANRFRGNLDDWDPAFLDALAQKNRVITFDYTGLASSTGVPHKTPEGYAQDIVDLADALKIGLFVVLGWSIGGFAAQAATLLHSNRVKQTVLIGTKPPGEVPYSIEEIFLKTAFIEDYTLDHEAILFFEPISKDSVEAAARSHARIKSRTDRDSRVKPELWETYTSVASEFEKDSGNLRNKLLENKIPLLIVSGDHEVCFPPENWFELNRKLESSQLIVIARSGHGPQHQYPEMVARYIQAFLQETK